jgi:dTDP-glucose 4,6-dehydratase
MEADVQTPVNIGKPDERTINELAETILDLTGSDSDITNEPLPPQDPKVRRPDISKAKSELNWEPDVSLRDGLERTIEYFEPRV